MYILFNTTVHEGEMKPPNMSDNIEAALQAFRDGKPVCLFDSDKREGETDLLFPALYAEPGTMRQLRKDCGGLLFLAVGHDVGEVFGLPFVLEHPFRSDSLQEQFYSIQQIVVWLKRGRDL